MKRACIACIFQELSLIPDLTVEDNIHITKPPTRLGLIDQRAQRRLAEESLARAGAEEIHPLSRIKDLSLSRRQMVEIAKALARNPKILILDEATSALTASDVEKVFRMLKQLRSDGLAIVYISHRMHEIAELADDCTVFRNGRFVETFKAGTKTDEAIVEMMIGREYRTVFPPKPSHVAETASVVEVKKLSWTDRLKEIDLSIRPGEVIGLGGLDGQGQDELLLALFGVLAGVSGTIEVNGRPVSPKSPRAAKAAEIGMALIPADRKTEGLILPMSVRENLSFAAIERFAHLGLINESAERASIERMIELLQIRSEGLSVPAGALSGGNQRKVVIGKWLMTKPRIILLNDPTRGVDVGTKQELYRTLRNLAGTGAAILFYSTDYDELIGCCDRVLVLYDGTMIRSLEGSAMNERSLVASALNLSEASVKRALPAQDRSSPPESNVFAGSLKPAPRKRQRDMGRKSDWHFLISSQRGLIFAATLFAGMFALYILKHPAGFSAKVINTAANKGALLALVAMAQTIPVLTAGLDLSVGMVFVLSDCIASTIAIGSIFGAFVLRTIGDLLLVFDLDPVWQPLFLGVVLLVSVSLGSFRLLRIKNKLELYQGSERSVRVRRSNRIDPVVLAAFGCIIALLIIGSFYSSNFISPEYLLQQLQVASFSRDYRLGSYAGDPSRPH